MVQLCNKYTFDDKIEITNDLHLLFSKMCNHDNSNLVYIDSRYLKLIVKYNIDVNIIQDYISSIIENVLLTNEKYNLHINLKSLSVTDFNKYNSLLHSMILMFRSKFVNKITKCYLYNTSYIFKLIHSFFKKFVSKEEQNDIIFVKE
jgi:hypothetical protein